MLVRYWMKENPIVVKEDDTLKDACVLMRDNKIRRLPVTEGKKLKGIIALSDLYYYLSPKMISKGENFEELEKHLVKEVMKTSPFTCELDTPLEDVGETMRKRKVGALPVINNECVVGIITESNVLDALVHIAHAGHRGRRICFRVSKERKKDIFSQIFTLISRYEIELFSVLTHEVFEESSWLVTLRFSGERAEDFVNAIWKKFGQVLSVD